MFRILKSLVLLLAMLGLLAYLVVPVRHPFVAARLLVQDAPAVLPVPVAGIQPRDLRDTWGAPRSGGRRHEGIDIFAPKGTAILSATSGLIWKIGQNRLGGNVVWVLGPGGEWHYYAHLDRFAALGAGDEVAPGTVLGYVGTSGNARGTPAHLHYGIYGPNGARNPFPRLAPKIRADTTAPSLVPVSVPAVPGS